MLRAPSTVSLAALTAVAFALLAAPVALAFFSHLPHWAPAAVGLGAVVGLALMPSAQRD